MRFHEGERAWTTSPEDSQRYVRARDLINAVIGALTSLEYEETDGTRREEYARLVQQEIAGCDNLDPDDSAAVTNVLETYPARLTALRAQKRT